MVFGVVGILFVLMLIGLAVASTVFWIWMLVDCASHESNDGSEKIAWILIILFTHVLGALLYFFIRRPRRLVRAGR